MKIYSFGIKHLDPDTLDLDFKIDCRGFANPHNMPELKHKTGLDEDVRDYVLTKLAGMERLKLITAPACAAAKEHSQIGCYCFGGRHRSVVVAESLAAHFRTKGWEVGVIHMNIPSST